MKLFLDTNIYLNFYHFSNDDLEELKKLIVAIKAGEITVYLTDQVENEFKRNREVKIADALKKFNEQKSLNQLPQMCKDYPEYLVIVDGSKQIEQARIQLLAKLKDDIKNKNLGADKIIQEIFSLAVKIPFSEQILSEAKQRYDLGNPPGKGSSYGDAINWVSLLFTPDINEDLYFIAKDKDYYSPIEESQMSDYLTEEWAEKKNSSIKMYLSLSDFFKEHFSDIKLATEMQRKISFDRLITSWNFSRTHSAVRTLSTYNDFTDSEVIKLIDAAIANTQINLIINDQDVRSFYLDLIQGRESIVPSDKLSEFYQLFNEGTSSYDEDLENLPF